MTGHNMIKMTELADLFKKQGFSDVRTYIQSGNVIFSTKNKATPSELSVKIAKALLDRFNYVIPVMTRSIDDLSELVNVNPYLNETGFDPSKMAVIFLTENPTDAQMIKVAEVNYPPDKFSIIGKEIHIYCPNGFGRTKIYTNFFENKMKVVGTARNWKTIVTLLEMAGQ
jgi:uncharacterized protein (DUF1697 family)